MDNYAFTIDPIELQRNVARKFPLLGRLPPGVNHYFSRFCPPVLLSCVVDVRSEQRGDTSEKRILPRDT